MHHNIEYYRKINDAHNSNSKKQTELHALQKRIQNDFLKTVNWELVTIGDRTQELLVMKSTDEKVKKIEARPNERLRLGEIVLWHGIQWLITKLDYDNQIQYAGVMTQCNMILRWQLDDLSTHVEFAVAEDATKYGTGVKDTSYIQMGEFSIKAKVQMNEHTLALKRDRRFLIGENAIGAKPTAYVLSRINQVTGSYLTADTDSGEQENYGYIELTLLEDVFREERDNAELWLADYVAPDGGNDQTGGDELW